MPQRKEKLKEKWLESRRSTDGGISPLFYRHDKVSVEAFVILKNFAEWAIVG